MFFSFDYLYKDCVALEELYLSHNGISKMEGLSSLVNLRVLDVSSNKLTSVNDIPNRAPREPHNTRTQRPSINNPMTYQNRRSKKPYYFPIFSRQPNKPPRKSRKHDQPQFYGIQKKERKEIEYLEAR
jgi:hypothetical protein